MVFVSSVVYFNFIVCMVDGSFENRCRIYYGLDCYWVHGLVMAKPTTRIFITVVREPNSLVLSSISSGIGYFNGYPANVD